jgi:hypothetical protein
VSKPQVSKPQKCVKLGRKCVALTSQAGPEPVKTNLSAATTLPVFIVDTAVVLVNILIKSVCNSCGPATRSVPAAGGVSHYSAPVAVSQPRRISSAVIHKIKRPGIRWQLSDPCERSLKTESHSMPRQCRSPAMP